MRKKESSSFQLQIIEISITKVLTNRLPPLIIKISIPYCHHIHHQTKSVHTYLIIETMIYISFYIKSTTHISFHVETITLFHARATAHISCHAGTTTSFHVKSITLFHINTITPFHVESTILFHIDTTASSHTKAITLFHAKAIVHIPSHIETTIHTPFNIEASTHIHFHIESTIQHILKIHPIHILPLISLLKIIFSVRSLEIASQRLFKPQFHRQHHRHRMI